MEGMKWKLKKKKKKNNNNNKKDYWIINAAGLEALTLEP